MTIRRLSWRLVLSTAAPVLLAHAVIFAIVAWLWPDSSGHDGNPLHLKSQAHFRWIAVSSAVIAIATTVILVVSQMRRWGRLLVRIAQTARGISSGDLNAPIEARGSRELELLGRAIDQMRQRLIGQVQQMDHQRRTFESMLNELREGVVLSDARGRVLMLNPAVIRLLNLGGSRTAAEYAGLAVERCIPQLDLQVLLTREGSSAKPAADGDAASPPRGESRLEIETATGTRHLVAQVSTVSLPDSASPGAVGCEGRLLVLTDITDLARSVQMKSDFVTNASHELRTPLSSIKAAVETLQGLDWARHPDAAKRCVNVIDRQSGRLEALAADLLDLSRVENAAASFRPRIQNLSELLQEIQSHFGGRLAAKELQFEVDRSACARTAVLANGQLIRLVLDNLLDNAIKFTDAGKRIRLELGSGPNSVTFSVVDEGCGISPEDQGRVFERFYQAERSRAGGSEERGTGLGLSIVRHAVGAMQGTVELKSTLGVGTQVRVTLPQPAA